MKTFLYVIGALMFGVSSIGFLSCKVVNEEVLEEAAMDFLTKKEGGWDVESVVVPPSSATVAEDWNDFNVGVLPSQMNTTGHAPGGNPVWPSGGWVLAQDEKTIARDDGVVMTVRELTATSFRVSFNYVDDTDGGAGTDGRIASLEGEYIFNLK